MHEPPPVNDPVRAVRHPYLAWQIGFVTFLVGLVVWFALFLAG